MTSGEQGARRALRSRVPLTNLVGRADDTAGLVTLLGQHRLVTVTGPGGVGKTRLAAEVARRVEDQFPDGVWFIDLGAVAEAAQVPAEVTSALGVRQDPGRPPREVLAEVLAPRRLLLVLDNCEHVLSSVADVCGLLLSSADEVRVLATSREQIGIAGETQYRLWPLELPGSEEPELVGQSAAAMLFIERAGQADRRFAVSPQTAPLIARVVARLDGMPLAIELAAARVEALGMAGLASRIDDALQMLTGTDPLAADRHQSLTAVADWSYQLLTEPEQRVFRRLAVFPGPFTLEAAEAVAGPGTGPAVLRLVDCSLLVPPGPGADQRTRYTMLQTLRAYGSEQLTRAGEYHEATAALAAFACQVAAQATAELERSDSEPAALLWLDAEDATLSRALTWALENDPECAMGLATGLAPWLFLRGRRAEARSRLRAAVARSSEPGETWARAQVWLGYLAAGDPAAAERYTAAIDAYQDQKPSPVLVEALAQGRAIEWLNRGNFAEAVQDSRRALDVARELGDPESELLALTSLSATTCYAGDTAESLDWTRQAQELLQPDIRGDMSRWCHYVLAQVLAETGELNSARHVCTAGLTLSRQAEDLTILSLLLGVMADIEQRVGDLAGAGTHMREAVSLASRTGHYQSLVSLIEQCGHLCAEAGRWADASTLWAAVDAHWKRRGRSAGPVNAGRRAAHMRRIEQALEPGQLRKAEERGARMSLSATTELALMVTAAAQEHPTAPAPGKLLSPRERELVMLVAQGHTNAEIADRLYISVRTVASHLDRIRDKTGYRRRADLTRLAIEESLV